MFHYFKVPCITCTFFTKFTYNEYIKPYFLSHIVSNFFAPPPPPPPRVFNWGPQLGDLLIVMEEEEERCSHQSVGGI